MNKLFILFTSLGLLTLTARAQSPSAKPVTPPFGKVDKTDLEMTVCDFEKDANAEILFDKANVYFDINPIAIVTERHQRIKIFNDNGKNRANIRLEYLSSSNLQFITNMEAETINLENGAVVRIKVDKKQIFTETVDKLFSAVVFSFQM